MTKGLTNHDESPGEQFSELIRYGVEFDLFWEPITLKQILENRRKEWKSTKE